MGASYRLINNVATVNMLQAPNKNSTPLKANNFLHLCFKQTAFFFIICNFIK
jgi:hypothetical protein